MNPGVMFPKVGTFIFSMGIEIPPSTISPPHFGQTFDLASLIHSASRYPLDNFATTE